MIVTVPDAVGGRLCDSTRRAEGLGEVVDESGRRSLPRVGLGLANWSHGGTSLGVTALGDAR